MENPMNADEVAVDRTSATAWLRPLGLIRRLQVRAPECCLTLALTILIPALSGTVIAQGEDPPIVNGELPAHLVAQLNYPSHWADEFYILGGEYGAVNETRLKVEISYENDSQNSVSIGYRFSRPGGIPGFKLDEHPTSFVPTAVCKEQGRGGAFFVAGWSKRTERVVIERWSIGVALVSLLALDQFGEPLPTTMNTPVITKEQIYNSPRAVDVQPIEGLSFNPISGHLYILMYGNDGPVFLMDVDDPSGSIMFLFDAGQFPELSEASGMRAFLHSDAGLVIAIRKHPIWNGAPGGFLAVGDANLDGSPDLSLIEYVADEDLATRYLGSGWQRAWVLP